MCITIINPVENKAWDSFVASHPLSTIYHTSAWAKVITLSYGYTPRYYVTTDKDGRITTGIPLFFINNGFIKNRLIGLPFSDTGEVLTTSLSETGALIDKILNDLQGHNHGFLEIRSQSNPHLSEISTLTPHHAYKTFVLELNHIPEKLRNKFQKSTIQRSIRKAERSKLTIRKASTEDDLKAFYHLNLMTRKKHGVLVQPYGFFNHLWKVLKSLNLIDILLAYIDNKAVAGIILLKFKDTVYYKYGASNETFLANYRPNHLLMWKAIELACHDGFKLFDFGRTSIDNQGLLEFKRRWGTEERPLTYFYFPKPGGINTLSTNGNGLHLAKYCIGHLPLFVNRLIGNISYKYLC